MRKFLAALCAFSLLVFASACASTDEPVVSAFREIEGNFPFVMAQHSSDWHFEDSIAEATDIMRASFLKCYEYETYVELEFKVQEILRGETDEDTIRVFTIPSGTTISDDKIVSTMYNFVVGHDYLLVLNREISVYDEYDTYRLASDIFIPLDDNVGVYMRNQPISEYIENTAIQAAVSSAQESRNSAAVATATSETVDLTSESNIVVEYVETLCQSLPDDYVPYTGLEYTTSTTLSDIVSASEYVLIVTVDKLDYVANARPTETYMCTTTEVFLEKAATPERIYVTFFEGTVQEGEQYLLLLNRAGDNSLSFGFSSKNSVIPLSDTEAVQEVRDLVAAQSDAVTE